MQPAADTSAATAAPKLKKESITLFAGYKTYIIGISNLSSNAKLSFLSSDVKTAKVSDAGIITPAAAGTAVVTATVKQNYKTYTLKTKVTVKNPYIEITARNDNLAKGGGYTYAGKTHGTSSKITWSSTDEKVIKINPSSGKAKAVSVGTAYITAQAGLVSSSFLVTVADASEDGVSEANEQAIPEASIFELEEAESVMQILGKNDINKEVYYHFKLDTAAYMYLTLWLEDESEVPYINCFLTDENNTILYDINSIEDSGNFNITLDILTPGDYYIKVCRTAAKAGSDINYGFFHSFSEREKEYSEYQDKSDVGDSFERLIASATVPGEEEFYYADIRNEDDVDYYKVNVTHGDLYVSLDFNMAEDIKYLNFKIVDANNNLVGSGELVKSDVSSHPDFYSTYVPDITDGYYYIVVYCSDSSMTRKIFYTIYEDK
jgi:hypothetical protein